MKLFDFFINKDQVVKNLEVKIFNFLQFIELNREDDEFDNTFRFYFSNIGGIKENNYLPMYHEVIEINDKKVASFKHLGIAFDIIDFQLYLVVYLSGNRDLKFNSGSKLHLIFEDKKHLIIRFKNNSIGETIIKWNHYPINPEEFKYFTDFNLLKWKFTDSTGFFIAGDNTFFGDATSNIQDKKTQQKALQHISNQIINEYYKL